MGGTVGKAGPSDLAPLGHLPRVRRGRTRWRHSNPKPRLKNPLPQDPPYPSDYVAAVLSPQRGDYFKSDEQLDIRFGGEV